MLVAVANPQTWHQGWELLLALALSSGIGLERELREKSAGLRTHALVGTGSALFMLIGKYGFADVVLPGRVVLDPSRVAAQIVSGIGFLGAGLIFVRRESVKGLTTAATVWLTAAVGAAAAAGLPVLAAGVTVGYFLVSVGYTPVVRRMPGRARTRTLVVRYRPGDGALPRVIAACNEAGVHVDSISVRRLGAADEATIAVPTATPAGRLIDLVAAVEMVEAVEVVETGERTEG